MSRSFNQIIADVHALNEDELMNLHHVIIGNIKHKRKIRAKQMKRELLVGNNVTFSDNDGQTVEGKVSKIMRKYAHVDVGDVIYRVPLNSLSKMTA